MKKYIIFGSIIFISVIIWLGYRSFFQGSVSLIVVPSQSSITINSNKSRVGTIFLNPGSYHISISHPGFTTTNADIQIYSGRKQELKVALLPNSTEGIEWYANHPNESLIAEGITGQKISQLTQDIQSNDKILSLLPFFRRDFRIDYGQSKKNPNDPLAIALYITYVDSGSKQRALDWIRSQGFNPQNYEIVYISLQ